MTVKLLGNGQSRSFEAIPSTKMIGKKKILMKVAWHQMILGKAMKS